MRHPSGENFAAATKSSCFNGPISRFPVESDQTQAVLSTELVRILVPSGETSIADTQPLCPLNSVTFLWLSASHTITLPSHVPLTIHFPSRDAAILKTSHPASIGVPFFPPSPTRQRRIFPSLPPLTTCCPSPRNATEYMTPAPSISIGFPPFCCTAERLSLVLLASPLIVAAFFGPLSPEEGLCFDSLCSRQHRPFHCLVHLLTPLWPQTKFGHTPLGWKGGCTARRLPLEHTRLINTATITLWALAQAIALTCGSMEPDNEQKREYSVAKW